MSFFPQGTPEEWMVVIYIMSGMYFLGGLFYAFFGSSELQEWAKDCEDDPERETIHVEDGKIRD